MIFRKKLNSGFTLVELLVTISIFAILTGVVLFNQTKFDSTILLTNLAYDTALTIRQAQTYGINIKEFDNNSNTNKFVPYGVHFETGANNKSFILFADINMDGIYDGDTSSCSPSYPGKSDGCVNRYNIKRGNYISDLCTIGVNSEACEPNTLDITFKRPNPDAIIKVIEGDSFDRARIVLSSIDGSTRSVRIWKNGLIEILNK